MCDYLGPAGKSVQNVYHSLCYNEAPCAVLLSIGMCEIFHTLSNLDIQEKKNKGKRKTTF